MTGGVNVGHDVDSPHPVPQLEVGLFVPDHSDSGVGTEEVDGAEALLGAFDEVFVGFGIGHISESGDTADFFGDGSGRVEIDVGDYKCGRTLLGEPTGQGGTDAAAPTGDYDDFLAEVHHVEIRSLPFGRRGRVSRWTMTHYRLEHVETLSDGCWRVISELADEALENLDFPSGSIEGVHEARKACKKARGLARLVRPALGSYSEANEHFRDAARQLGPIRDPQAFLDTFDVLRKSPAASDYVRSLRVHFELQATQATERIHGAEAWRLDEARELIRAGRLDAGAWEMEHSFDSIRGGVELTYRRGREAMVRARQSGNPEDFHEWRKRAKYLWYQIRLLRNTSRSMLQPLARRLHEVSDALGDAHDLALMQRQVESFDAYDAAKEAFRIVTSGYILELETRALSLGSRLWAEKPSRFVDRLELYWEAWRDGNELKVGEIGDITPTSDIPRRLFSTA